MEHELKLQQFQFAIHNGGTAAVPIARRRQKFTGTNMHVRHVRLWKEKGRKGSKSTETPCHVTLCSRMKEVAYGPLKCCLTVLF